MGGREEVGSIEEGKTIVEIYYKRKESILKEIKEKDWNQTFSGKSKCNWKY